MHACSRDYFTKTSLIVDHACMRRNRLDTGGRQNRCGQGQKGDPINIDY